MKRLFILIMMVFLMLPFSLGVSAHSAKTELTSRDALKLTITAREHFWFSMSGHNPKYKGSTCSEGSFTYKGSDYRFFCSELDTKKEFVKYNSTAFTLNAINKGMAKYRFIEYKGKLAQPNADGGSLLEWGKAKVKLLYQRAGIRLFEFTVPYGEKVQYDKKKVTFVKVNGVWLVNEFDAVR